MFIKLYLKMIVVLNVFSFMINNSVDSYSLDQRQSGDYNVQVDVKDVQIFALMKGSKEEYVDYDYAYDYSELTIKPQNRTTPKPFNVTSASIPPTPTTISTTVLQDHTIAPIKFDQHSLEFSGTTATSTDIDNTTLKSIPDAIPEVEQSSTPVNIPTSSSTPRTTTTKCKKGFALNNKGECQLKLNSNGNALLKLVRLSQKLKLRRENKSKSNY